LQKPFQRRSSAASNDTRRACAGQSTGVVALRATIQAFQDLQQQSAIKVFHLGGRRCSNEQSYRPCCVQLHLQARVFWPKDLAHSRCAHHKRVGRRRSL